MPSLADKMVGANNRPAGFDYLRLLLATAVIASHAPYAESVAYVGGEWNAPWRGIVGLILPCFFALSGFLVAGSLDRTDSLITFLGLRVIRLIPALLVEVTLSALVLGVIFTSLPLHSYLRSPEFIRYFGNVIGLVHFTLPGVFQNNPSPAVNSQLWTLPYELECYLAISLLAVLGIASRRWLLLTVLCLVQAAFVWRTVEHLDQPLGVIEGRSLVLSFLAGVGLFKFKEYVPHDRMLLGSCVVAACSLLLTRVADDLIALPVAYIIAWLGVTSPPRDKWLLSGDYSYGLYLYGFPIQQAVTGLGSWTHSWFVNLLIAYPVAFGFAAFSWWFIERPALGLKAVLMRCERNALRFPPLRWHSQRVYCQANRART